MSTQRHPEHHAALIEKRAHKKPLPPAEMTRASNQIDALVELPHLDAEPSFVGAPHVRCDYAGGYVIAGVIVGPPNACLRA